MQDVVVLSERTEHLPLIEIRIKECQGDTIAAVTSSGYNAARVNDFDCSAELLHDLTLCGSL